MLNLELIKKLIFLLLILIQISEAYLEFNNINLTVWTNYKAQTGLSKKNLVHYIDNEKKRIKIFMDNLKHIKSHNLQSRQKSFSRKPTFTMGPNHLAHLTLNEINSRYASFINKKEIEFSAKFILKRRNNTDNEKNLRNKRAIIEDSVDWLKRGYVSPATDQGGCGSCYAFSTAWAVESAFAIKHNVRFNVNQFSKQQLVDCTYYTEKDNNDIGYSNIGCYGGNVYRTLLYVFNNGLELEADYPYVSDKRIHNNGQIQKCMYNTKKFSLKINNYYGINFRDIEEMKRVVSKQPVVAYFYVTYDFYFYSSGIYTTDQCGRDNCERINHSVLIVGYGVENGISYWLCKNSWGTNWGEKGYFRVEMKTNMCCVEAFSIYPTL